MEFNVWIERQGTQPQYKGLRGATVKAGPQVCKTVHIAKFGPADSDEVSKTELRFKTSPRSQIGPGYDFDSPSSQWACENDEIETLLAFLHSDVERAGRYRVVDTASPIAEILDALETGSWDGEQLAEFVRRSDASSLGNALTTSSAGLAAAETAVLLRRRELIERAQQAAEDQSSNETAMQRLIGSEWWIFGGHYIGPAPRADLLPFDRHDIPLLKADGSLFIVELKGPVVPTLVRRHRNHWIVGKEVHEAVGQAMNYIRIADETGTTVGEQWRRDHGVDVDFSRVSALVVIGHPAHADEEARGHVDHAIRTYNSHLSRVEVVTYERLFDAASRALRFEEEALASSLADEHESPTHPVPEPTSAPPEGEDPW